MTQFSLGTFLPVADRVFVAVAEPAAVNIGLVVGESGAVVIDTGSSPEQGAAIKAAAEAFAGVPVTHVIVTHWHYDHLFGLAGFGGVPSYAHASVLERLAGPDAAAAATDLGVAVDSLAQPDTVFWLAKALDAGGRRVEALHFGPGHTDGDLVVYVPDADVVFAGDLLESAEGGPSFGASSQPKEWPTAVDGILGLVGEKTVIVPGHGPVIERVAAFNQRAEISGVHSQAEMLFERGVPESEAYASVQWPFAEPSIRQAISVVYRQLTEAGVRPTKQLPLLTQPPAPTA